MKFASVTAQLLARKGEARPWLEPAGRNPILKAAAPPATDLRLKANEEQQKVVQPVFVPEPQPAGRREKASNPDVKKMSVRMSQHDYERLGILAVKKGASRQHLVQEALEYLLSREAKRLQCSCLGNACGADCLGS